MPEATCIPTTSTSDTALLRLCAEFLRRDAEILRLGSSKDLDEKLVRRLLVATLRQRKLLAQIAGIPPVSLQGWREKFKCAITSLGPAEAGDMPEVQFCRRVLTEFCCVGSQS